MLATRKVGHRGWPLLAASHGAVRSPIMIMIPNRDTASPSLPLCAEVPQWAWAARCRQWPQGFSLSTMLDATVDPGPGLLAS
jgi:hypothetical protein